MARPRTAPKRPVARKEPTQSRSRETVDVILVAAERLLARDGLAGFTTPRIAEIAGVSVGSLYQYFPNKEAICGALIERATLQVHQVLLAAIAATRSMPFDRAFRSVSEAALSVFLQSSRLHTGLMEMIPAAGRQALYQRMLAQHTAVLAEAITARGAEVRQPGRLSAYVVVRAADGVIQAISRDALDEAGIREVVREVIEMGIAYLRPPR